MLSKRINKKLKILLLFTMISLTLSCQTDHKVPTGYFSIIYSLKADNNNSIYLSDDQGKTRLKVVDVTPYDGYPTVSPTGKLIAFYSKYDKGNTWSIHSAYIDGSNIRRLTHVENVWDSAPAWSPDGSTIAFAREYKGVNGDWQEEIWLMNADGSEQRKIKALQGRAPEFLNDGRLLFQSKASPSQISIANIDGSNVIQLTNDDTDNRSPKISPDGSQIAYLSNKDGNQEVYMMNVDGGNKKRLTFNRVEEWDPAWSIDGSKVFFSSQNVYGFYDIYKINKDGSSIEKILTSGYQSATVHHVDKSYLESLLKSSNNKFITVVGN